jgi:hypothetical protein
MKKREWCYCQQPVAYDMHCDKCKGTNITWSEFEGMLWCYDCEIDTPGFPGIFDGPIPVVTCKLMGISFDRIRLSDGKLLKMKIIEGGLEWNEE